MMLVAQNTLNIKSIHIWHIKALSLYFQSCRGSLKGRKTEFMRYLTMMVEDMWTGIISFPPSASATLGLSRFWEFSCSSYLMNPCQNSCLSKSYKPYVRIIKIAFWLKKLMDNKLIYMTLIRLSKGCWKEKHL